MTLTFDQIRDITFGAVKIEQKEGCIQLRRMRDSQAKAFIKEREAFAEKTEATAGIRFDFYTDSDYVKVNLLNLRSVSKRKFFGIDVLLNGILYMHYYADDLSTEYPDTIFIPLNKKYNHIQLFFPNLATTDVKTVELADGCKVDPFVPKMNFISYGDSITEGFDAKFSSKSYINIIAAALEAQVINLGVAGGKHNSEIIEDLDITPDFITVAYGTNDWAIWDSEKTMREKVTEFYDKLVQVHKDIKIFTILPIWREDSLKDKPVGNFYDCRKMISNIAQSHGCIVIDDINLVPHDDRLYTAHCVHPNDTGFEVYGSTIVEHIKKHI